MSNDACLIEESRPYPQQGEDGPGQQTADSAGNNKIVTAVTFGRFDLFVDGVVLEFSNKKGGENRPYGGGNATGVKIDPIGFLVIKEGNVRMINILPAANTTIDRIIDLVPQVIDRVEGFINKQNEE